MGSRVKVMTEIWRGTVEGRQSGSHITSIRSGRQIHVGPLDGMEEGRFPTLHENWPNWGRRKKKIEQIKKDQPRQEHFCGAQLGVSTTIAIQSGAQLFRHKKNKKSRRHVDISNIFKYL